MRKKTLVMILGIVCLLVVLTFCFFVAAIIGIICLQRFVTVFPTACVQFHGPHSVACYNSIWKEAGCAVEGWSYPHNMTGNQLTQLRRLDLTYDRLIDPCFNRIMKRTNYILVKLGLRFSIPWTEQDSAVLRHDHMQLHHEIVFVITYEP